MNNTLVYSDILKSTKTVAQREILSAEIDRLLTSLFQKKEDFEETLVSIRLEIAQIIRDEFINKDSPNQEMTKDFLSRLKKELENLRLIKLSLAFSATEHTIDKIYDWIVKNVGDGYILDIEVNESILGGCVIAFEGRYVDLSLKKSLDEVFENKKQEITKSLE